ncbi:MAG: hypothetical protein A2667_03365 [Candidatus Wildermuthbacteria bacterium RIFCSPHIGHO2_01_FULL_47_27]|uniref:Methyltransferase type 11 domain-containing protein n=1 Tax=Candidatus Wildermuthbacteria bacterium RIFCSPHIGHO2_02_FULL_47_17 TaxID=1802452 RepID=A0A1G2R2H1_9BACT|nr:MAG: SAM-dependent methyltransferase [Parcubacteria group bacterium GW2011_GWA2_47_9]OHA65031.1 MAG: hypothetical protein A2667_03365 [Candidatus Wildermuthbacteria bacterium RIFCSPHIGHO2_01_FULL_47_27]OHA67055.1 MAG: hypothetical protein A3D59_02290 [Candidatus Wildermuthbacteria bacterium RIFCSPHIGHO2_02_FULL_47_17]
MNKKELYSNPFFQKTKDELRSDRLKKVARIINQHGGRLLDIGCGTGALTVEFGGHVLYGVDISEESVKIAQGRGIDAIALDIDEEKLPFEDNFFDIIFCGEVVEHIFDPDHLLDEIYRVLKPGGIAVITTPNLASYLNRIALLFGFQPYFTGTGLRHNTGKFFGDKAPCPHLIVFTLRSLRELFKLHGFKAQRIIGADISHLLPQPLAVIDKIFAKIPALAAGLIFVVKK